MNNSTFGMGSFNPSFGAHHKSLTTTAKQATFGFPRRDLDADRIMSRLSSLNEDRRESIYTFVTNLKSDLGILNLTDAFDYMYMFAAATQSDSFINWAQPGTYDCTLVGAGMQFTPNRGWKQGAISSTSYLNSNFNPFNLAGINYGPGTFSSIYDVSGSWGLYLNTSVSSFLQADWWSFGACNGPDGTPASFSPRSSGGFFVYSVLGVNRPGTGINQFNSPLRNLEGGLFSAVRPDYSTTELYFNGDLIDKRIGAVAFTAVRDRGPLIYGNLNYNSAGGTAVNIAIANSAQPSMMSFAYVGGKNIKPDVITRRLSEYFYSIGAQSFIAPTRAS